MEASIQTMLRGLRLQTKCHTRHLGTTYDKLSQMGDRLDWHEHRFLISSPPLTWISSMAGSLFYFSTFNS